MESSYKEYIMPKKVLVALPPGLLEQVDFIASVEHRSRSDLIREALRRYIEYFKRNQSTLVAPQAVSGNGIEGAPQVVA
jgi:metal-responsive CopG/Arc/MetJ family transcriptional regulator